MGPPVRIAINRETWLTNAIIELKKLFVTKGLTLPGNVVVSCGWPGSGSIRKCAGECWPSTQSAGGKFEIFISPLLSEAAGPQGVLATLVHELGHVIVGLDIGHKKPFKQFMEKTGLEGKAKATMAGPNLCGELDTIIKTLGHYPHSTLNLKDKQTKKQGTRLVKIQCPECDYVLRATRKHLDEKGAPICPLHKVPFNESDCDETSQTS